MADSYDLAKLDSSSFEHLVNALALKVLGAGHTGFGPGKDGGRDGFFEGIAPYPSEFDRWSGTWYIQSKFHKPHLSTDSQKWLRDQVNAEIAAFNEPGSRREWPNNWIVASNVEPSGAAGSGTFDRCRAAVHRAHPPLSGRFHIWGGMKILSLLASYPEVARQYAHLMTPGELIAELRDTLGDSAAGLQQIMRYFIVTAFDDQQYTKLEQAGSDADNRPGIQDVFTELPFTTSESQRRRRALEELTVSSALRRVPRSDGQLNDPYWERWNADPRRARTWLIKGGPGQGKSTLTQYISQIQRAALIIGGALAVTPTQEARAKRVEAVSQSQGLWPLSPRVPVYLELKEYAKWVANQLPTSPHRLLTYLVARLSQGIGQSVHAGSLNRAFGAGRWLFVLDGLDEVPGDVKDSISNEIIYFINDYLVGCRSDALIVCTSRPQGYSGQLDGLGGAIVTLGKLTPDEALACATPVLTNGRTAAEFQQDISTLRIAIESPAVREIMTTPLQSHIMAVVIRSGGRPPERRWQLFDNFYNVIKKRETNRGLADPKVAGILLKGDQLLKALHSRLGFELHYRAERSEGANTSLTRPELRQLVQEVVEGLLEIDVDETIEAVMEATTERLVLVNTPDSGENVRFDIRPLQEFFAAEHIHESGEYQSLAERVGTILGDSHWREVIHFLFSALVERSKKTELYAAIDLAGQLDASAEDDLLRPLRRRLAAGSAIVGRLLSEGVLEQDKRVRQRFSMVLDALWGCTDAPWLFGAVDGPHSKDWICTSALAALKERKEPENIGAALVLCFNMSDTDARLEEVKALLASMSRNNLKTLFDIVIQKLDGVPPGSPELPRWLQDIAVTYLRQIQAPAEGGWPSFSALRVIQRGKTPAKVILAELTGIVAAGEAFEAMFSDDLNGRSASKLEKRLGMLRLQVREANADIVDFLAPDVEEAFRHLGGMFEFLAVVLSAMRAVATDTAIEDESKQLLSRYPFDIPANAQSYAFEPLFMYLPEFPTLLRMRRRSDPVKAFAGIADPEKPAEITQIFEQYPDLGFHALRALSDMRSDAKARRLNKRAITALTAALNRDNLVLLSVGALSAFVRLQPQDAKSRDAFVARLAKQEPPRFYYPEVHPFEVMLPREAALLPHVLTALTRHEGFFPRDYGEEKRTGVERTAHRHRMFFPNMDGLAEVARDEAGCDYVCAAARVLLMMGSIMAEDARVRAAAALESLDGSIEWWLAAGAAQAFTDLRLVDYNVAAEAMSELMARLSGRIDLRHLVSPTLQVWREHAGAPVHQAGNLSIWRF